MAHTEVTTPCIFRCLMRSSNGPEGVLQPNLAAESTKPKEWRISQDGLQWRIRLRDDVRWHDGEPFTAEDVKFTLELITNPKFRAWRTSGHSLVRISRWSHPRRSPGGWSPFSRPTCRFSPRPSWCRGTFSRRRQDPNAAGFNQAPIWHWSIQVGATYRRRSYRTLANR